MYVFTDREGTKFIMQALSKLEEMSYLAWFHWSDFINLLVLIHYEPETSKTMLGQSLRVLFWDTFTT